MLNQSEGLEKHTSVLNGPVVLSLQKGHMGQRRLDDIPLSRRVCVCVCPPEIMKTVRL